METSSLQPKKHPCCNVSSNLEAKDSGKKDLELLVCKVCGARHFELTIDPIDVGVELK